MPILYSFKRCPYAMRARMAIYLSQIVVEHREVSLKNKPKSMMEISPKGTVPVLLLENGDVIDESMDIINWCLETKSRVFKDILDDSQKAFTKKIIKIFDEKFKFHLDRYKYATRYKNVDAVSHRDACLDILKTLDKNKTIIVGYSYGGPIALAVKAAYKKIVLVAPAVYSKVEPMPWMLNFYKWKATRWLVPTIWKSASEEKMNHRTELEKFEHNWKLNPSKIISIHGDEDGIVPYENSLFLQEQFPEEQFKLITVPDTGHALVWTQFELIKSELLKQLH